MKNIVRHALVLSVVCSLWGGLLGPAGAAEENKGLVLRNDEKCTACHDEADDSQPGFLELQKSVLSIGKTKHGTTADARTPTCTSCHGESDDHVNHKGSGKPPKPDVIFGNNTTVAAHERNQSCLNCHQGSKHINWQSSTHANRDVTCTSCHSVHNSGHDKVRDKKTQTEVCYSCHKEQRSQMGRPSHHPVPEGQMACTSCHDVHNDNPKALLKSSTNDTCYTCHMEKRGPFVHSHQPVTEDCGICHQPHGTTAPSLLKTRAPFLCQSCHDPASHHGSAIGQPTGGPDSATGKFQTVGRACLNCHTNIHGGNSLLNVNQAESLRR